VEVGPNGNALAAFERVRERLLAYDIFPPWLMRHASCPAGRLAEGTTIVQRELVGPLALEMAVRVLAVWDRSDGVAREAGLSYVTLVGHAECGVGPRRNVDPCQRRAVWRRGGFPNMVGGQLGRQNPPLRGHAGIMRVLQSRRRALEHDDRRPPQSLPAARGRRRG
jgi:hypothetical protein